jgi:hypothetical protein
VTPRIPTSLHFPVAISVIQEGTWHSNQQFWLFVREESSRESSPLHLEMKDDFRLSV